MASWPILRGFKQASLSLDIHFCLQVTEMFALKTDNLANLILEICKCISINYDFICVLQQWFLIKFCLFKVSSKGS